MRKLIKFAKDKILIIWCVIFFVIIYYVEVYSYARNWKTWADLKCDKKTVCTKILLVADPQLIGYQNEPFGLTPFSVWDSDRYLAKTFDHAFKFANPDIVIFLGDLFDEGSIASDYEFRRYGRRLFNIFLVGDAAKVKHIWIPGDNDIGGEGREKVSMQNLKRFDQMFQQPDTIHMRNITFYKVNRLLQTVPKLPQTVEFFDTSKLVIGLSHIPLMFIPSPFVEKVLSRMQPHLLFTAHEHKSMIISTDALLRDARQIIPITPKTKLVHSVTLGVTEMFEIIVPTCSYRMGTDKMGFGFAILENNDLKYTVLWSPPRFSQLLTYIAAFKVFLLFLFFRLFKRCTKK